jgi:hypothetical protein
LQLLGANLGLRDLVVAFWDQHPSLAIPSMAAAILLFTALVEFGIGSLRTDHAYPRASRTKFDR